MRKAFRRQVENSSDYLRCICGSLNQYKENKRGVRCLTDIIHPFVYGINRNKKAENYTVLSSFAVYTAIIDPAGRFVKRFFIFRRIAYFLLYVSC